MRVRIGIDLMGSDSSPESIFEAVLKFSSEIEPQDSLVVFATHSLFPQLKKKYSPFPSSIGFMTTDESIEMEESPLLAVRRKKNASMAAGIRLLKENEIDAFVSTGNTGALVAFATLHLPLLESVERPGLLVMMPTEKGMVAVIDVGANINPKPEHLTAYAHLGALYQQECFAIRNPKVGLLNIGVEEQKGTKEHKQAYYLLQKEFGKAFYGNIEGREVFQGKIDVLVTDGFTGNVFLKTSEGISSFLAEYLQNHFKIPEIVDHLYHQFNYSEHPGAFLCGVEGIVVKCHGFSDQNALMNGIRGASTLVRKKIIEKLKSRL